MEMSQCGQETFPDMCKIIIRYHHIRDMWQNFETPETYRRLRRRATVKPPLPCGRRRTETFFPSQL